MLEINYIHVPSILDLLFSKYLYRKLKKREFHKENIVHFVVIIARGSVKIDLKIVKTLKYSKNSIYSRVVHYNNHSQISLYIQMSLYVAVGARQRDSGDRFAVPCS